MNWSVEEIIQKDSRIVKRLEEIEAQAFGVAGLNAWMLVPLIRHGRVFMLRMEKKMIGGAQFFRDWEDPARAYLVGIAVDYDYRGQGLGTLFLNECMRVLKEEGVRSVELTVDAANEPAVRVYAGKLGFSITETRKDEYGAGVDRVVMERQL